MYTCTINEVQYLECKNLKLDCNTPYTSANGGDYGHMLEIFMIVDFPNGYDMCKNNGIFFFLITVYYVFLFKNIFFMFIR